MEPTPLTSDNAEKKQTGSKRLSATTFSRSKVIKFLNEILFDVKEIDTDAVTKHQQSKGKTNDLHRLN